VRAAADAPEPLQLRPVRVTLTPCLVVSASVGALALAAPFALGASAHPSYPGSAAAGKGIFVEDCGKCHTMAAANSAGTLGPNLDRLPGVTFNVVVTAVMEGAGGIDAEYAIHNVCTGGSDLKCLTFAQLNDVAKFVVTEDGRPAYQQQVAQPVPT
jgi:mono/diheme cytochrome c family protein